MKSNRRRSQGGGRGVCVPSVANRSANTWIKVGSDFKECISYRGISSNFSGIIFFQTSITGNGGVVGEPCLVLTLALWQGFSCMAVACAAVGMYVLCELKVTVADIAMVLVEGNYVEEDDTLRFNQ